MIHAAAARGILAVLLAAAVLAGVRPAAASQAADVPYVPTPRNVVDAMLKIGRVGPADYLIDLGCGDGRIVITAAKQFGTRGFGVDLDPTLVSDARRAAERAGVADRVDFHARNLFNTDISRATVVTMYLLQSVNLRLRPRLLEELAPGTRIVSHDFDLEDWEPDARVTVPVPDKPYGPPSSEVFMWLVPANAAGEWRWRATVAGEPREYVLMLDQAFQMVHGAIHVDGHPAGFARGRMEGDLIRFAVVADVGGRARPHEFSGRVSAGGITGTFTVAGDIPETVEWRAARGAHGSMDIGAGAAAPVSQRVF